MCAVSAVCLLLIATLTQCLLVARMSTDDRNEEAYFLQRYHDSYHNINHLIGVT